MDGFASSRTFGGRPCGEVRGEGGLRLGWADRVVVPGHRDHGQAVAGARRAGARARRTARPRRRSRGPAPAGGRSRSRRRGRPRSRRESIDRARSGWAPSSAQELDQAGPALTQERLAADVQVGEEDGPPSRGERPTTRSSGTSGRSTASATAVSVSVSAEKRSLTPTTSSRRNGNARPGESLGRARRANRFRRPGTGSVWWRLEVSRTSRTIPTTEAVPSPGRRSRTGRRFARFGRPRSIRCRAGTASGRGPRYATIGWPGDRRAGVPFDESSNGRRGGAGRWRSLQGDRRTERAPRPGRTGCVQRGPPRPSRA